MISIYKIQVLLYCLFLSMKTPIILLKINFWKTVNFINLDLNFDFIKNNCSIIKC